MDIASVAGLVLAWAMVLGSILVGSSLGIFINVPSILVVVGGSIGAILMCFPMSTVTGVVGVIKNAFFHKVMPPADLIKMLVEFSVKARKEGILAMEDTASSLDDAFLKKGLQLAVDGTSPDLVREILETELSFIEDRHKEGQGLVNAFATFAPAYGMIGTLIGLVIMLSGMDDPASIGPGMAVALITTLYGSLIANAIALPLVEKLKAFSAAEILNKQLMIEGVLSIQSGHNPRVVEHKLKSYISPSQRNFELFE